MHRHGSHADCVGDSRAACGGVRCVRQTRRAGRTSCTHDGRRELSTRPVFLQRSGDVPAVNGRQFKRRCSTQQPAFLCPPLFVSGAQSAKILGASMGEFVAAPSSSASSQPAALCASCSKPLKPVAHRRLLRARTLQQADISQSEWTRGVLMIDLTCSNAPRRQRRIAAASSRGVVCAGAAPWQLVQFAAVAPAPARCTPTAVQRVAPRDTVVRTMQAGANCSTTCPNPSPP